MADLLTALGKERFLAIKAHYLATGLTTRVHKNTKRLPKNTLSIVDVRNFVRFLRSYAELNGMLLPGRVPGYKRDDLQLLPSSTTKKVITYLKTVTSVHFSCTIVGLG